MSTTFSFRVIAIAITIDLIASIAMAQITVPTMTIGNPGNGSDPATGHGAVWYPFCIGQTEVTNAQYAVFLNAVARDDPREVHFPELALYNPEMAGPYGGITRSGSAGSFTYATIPGREDHPVNFVSFWDACRFANWLHNGQGSGSTETGAYELATVPPSSSISRTVTWRWAVTSRDEWYKAAYHQPASQGGDSDDYWLYPTSSNSAPTFAQANYDWAINNTTRVASYAPNFYNVFDLGGNVTEWNESTFLFYREIRGGSFVNSGNLLSAVQSQWAWEESRFIGFRVVRNTCRVADWDRNGEIEPLDIAAFFADFRAGNGDIDNNGETEPLDITLFFELYRAGC